MYVYLKPEKEKINNSWKYLHGPGLLDMMGIATGKWRKYNEHMDPTEIISGMADNNKLLFQEYLALLNSYSFTSQ